MATRQTSVLLMLKHICKEQRSCFIREDIEEDDDDTTLRRARTSDLPGIKELRGATRRMALMKNLRESVKVDRLSSTLEKFDFEWEEVIAGKNVEQLHSGSPIEQENAANTLRLLAIENRLAIPKHVLEIVIIEIADKLTNFPLDSMRYEASYVKALLSLASSLLPEHLIFMLVADYVSILTSVLRKHNDTLVHEEVTKCLLKFTVCCLNSEEGIQAAYFTLKGKPALVALLESIPKIPKVLDDWTLKQLLLLVECLNPVISQWAALVLFRMTFDSNGEGQFAANIENGRRLAQANGLRSFMIGARNAPKEDRKSFLVAVGSIANSTTKLNRISVDELDVTWFLDSLSECSDCYKDACVYALNGLAKCDGGLKGIVLYFQQKVFWTYCLYCFPYSRSICCFVSSSAIAMPSVVSFLFEAANEESFFKVQFNLTGSALASCPPSLWATATLCTIANSQDPEVASKVSSIVPVLLSKLFLANGFLAGKAKTAELPKYREELAFDCYVSDLMSLKGELGYF